MFIFVRLRTWNFGTEKCQKRDISVGHHDTNRARPTPTPTGSGESSKVMHAQETARREVDLSSSCLEDNSKPGLRPLSCQGQHFDTCIYLFILIPGRNLLPVFFFFVIFCTACCSSYFLLCLAFVVLSLLCYPHPVRCCRVPGISFFFPLLFIWHWFWFELSFSQQSIGVFFLVFSPFLCVCSSNA